MTLVLEIEHLTETAFAALGPDSDAPDWPPQPDRVFSALVASWAAHGSPDAERRALEWLESQPAPFILASTATPRSAPVSFVPPNDPQSGKSGDRTVMPAFRRRQPRRFPAARPDDPVVRLYWNDLRPDEETFGALRRLAADTSYVGHSASLTRCHSSLPMANRCRTKQDSLRGASIPDAWRNCAARMATAAVPCPARPFPSYQKLPRSRKRASSATDG